VSNTKKEGCQPNRSLREAKKLMSLLNNKRYIPIIKNHQEFKIIEKTVSLKLINYGISEEGKEKFRYLI
jgi:hypothetical protein